jgi:hypothetical protein
VRKLIDQWRAETEFLSSSHELVLHQAYQRIIGYGRAALPAILADLAAGGAHWQWALAAITGEDPVPREAWGRRAAIASAWLAWAREQGYDVQR